MTRKPTPWKLDRPYDPDARAESLRRRFARYRQRNGAGGSGDGRRTRFAPAWFLVVAGIGAFLAFAVGTA